MESSYGLTRLISVTLFVFVIAASFDDSSAAPSDGGSRSALRSAASRLPLPALKTASTRNGDSKDATAAIESLKISGNFHIQPLDDVSSASSEFGSYPSGLRAQSDGAKGIFYEPREAGNSTICSNTSDSGTCVSFGRPDSHFNEITHQGGKVMTGRVNVYLIYYGSWVQGMGQDVFENFIASLTDASADSLGPSVHKWWSITSLYNQSDGQLATSDIVLKQSVNVNSTQNLDGGEAVLNVISQLLLHRRLPFDPNGIYALLSSSGIKQSMGTGGFCTSFCGWHSAASYLKGTLSLKYLYVGWTADCEGCQRSYARGTTPNGNPQMEGMVSILAHELTETVTNPDLVTGWFDPLSNDENADACSFFFPGLLSAAPPYFNLYGTRGYRYLIQANIDPRTQKCVMEGPAVVVPGRQCLSPVVGGTRRSGRCTCTAVQTSKDGCVCSSKGKCVRFCAAREGRLCTHCDGPLCTCRKGICTAMR